MGAVKEWLNNCRESRKLILFIVAIALLLDNMLLTTVGKWRQLFRGEGQGEGKEGRRWGKDKWRRRGDEKGKWGEGRRVDIVPLPHFFLFFYLLFTSIIVMCVGRCIPLLYTVGVRIYSSLEKNNAPFLPMSTDYALCCVCRICRSLPLLGCRRFPFITLRINVYYSPMLQDFPYISPPTGSQFVFL